LAEGKGRILAVRIGYGFGLILGLVGIFLIDLLSKQNYATTLLGVAVVGVGLWEFYSMCERKGLRPWKATGALAGSGLLLAQWGDLRLAAGAPVSITAAAFLGVFALLCFLALIRKTRSSVLEDLGTTLLGLVYVWFLLNFAFLLRNDPALPGSTGLWITFLMVGTSKSGDIGAFFTGTFIGRHRLAPAISPNKTLEGSAGGLLCSVAFSVVFSRILPECRAFFPLWASVLFGLTVGLLSQAGDLFESMLKRSVHVKDSGAIIPEFGGVLDLLDGVLFAGPAAWFFVLLFE
jgi:phosphatidate cytidylyltransferase